MTPAYQAESFTLVYYVMEIAKPEGNGYRIMEVRHVMGAFGVTLRTTRAQVEWFRNFYVAQDVLKKWNGKAARIVWHKETAQAGNGLQL